MQKSPGLIKDDLEIRKQEERDFHNLVRDKSTKQDPVRYKYYFSNRKYYAVHRKQVSAVENWWSENIPGRKVLDYCTGGGQFAVEIAKHSPEKIVGIDISDVSVKASEQLAQQEGFDQLCEFRVMDAEAMKFEDNSFDVVHERGALHHLDLEKAYSEIARVLRPNGKALCSEALVHNPIIHLYRKMTPHLRTAWEVEHILGKKQIQLAEKYFHKVEIVGFFNLTTLLAVPLRNMSIFNPILGFLENVDDLLFKIPWVKWQAWSAVFCLSNPIKY